MSYLLRSFNSISKIRFLSLQVIVEILILQLFISVFVNIIEKLEITPSQDISLTWRFHHVKELRLIHLKSAKNCKP